MSHVRIAVALRVTSTSPTVEVQLGPPTLSPQLTPCDAPGDRISAFADPIDNDQEAE